MPEVAAITPDDLREHAGLTSDVPEATLARHIGIATRDLVERTGVEAAPEGHHENWRDAVVNRALASAFPWLNTFALEGAAKVGGLENSVEFRFLSPDEVDARVSELNVTYYDLARRIRLAAKVDEDDLTPMFMTAV